MKDIIVNTQYVYPNKYSILFTDSVRAITDLLEKHNGRKAMIVTDENVKRYYNGIIQRRISQGSNIYQLDEYVVKAGEEYKTSYTVDGILNELFKKQYAKNDLLISVGGGVINDLTGYVASIYKRGMTWATIPTTLLAMVDASIGGKTAINNDFGKNMVGCMYNPSCVMVDTSYLQTLPQIRLIEGIVELSKHFILFDENNFLDLKNIIKQTDNIKSVILSEEFNELLMESIKIKKKVVEEDQREAGLRKVLNLGHTIGHAIEKIDPTITHGLAVAKGTIAELTYGIKIGIVDKNSLEEITSFYSMMGVDYNIGVDSGVGVGVGKLKDKNIIIDKLIKYMINDKKKTKADKIPIVLINKIGEIYKDEESFTCDVDKNEMMHFLEDYVK